MKIYIASSWKNEKRLLKIAENLRFAGHEVDLFCEVKKGRHIFNPTMLDFDIRDFNAIEYLGTKESKKIFEEDKKWIHWADAVLLVLPSGKSSHLEAGYAKGIDKKVFVLGPYKIGEVDAMYHFADKMFDSIAYICSSCL